ncbi:thiamine biosynthesis protein ApbE [Suicoccus acidiformans]|uniref:FAD:protein FMN transferase n=1 Tax=Suicoccus acidiformans TaxID=2036206 RepID=A0A347WKQ4_9LACT|nr:FAD:protein FMN transferase [Suicoccus acidiformans]AXY25661.1 thiamine biosynthesis protein ApbE [Suicoccus acidiformans]
MVRLQREVKQMGTVITISVTHPHADIILNEVEARLQEYEQRFSANDASSELMKVNQAAGQKAVSVHPDLYALIKLGLQHSLAHGSHLNIAIGPLVQLWRIGFSDAQLPSTNQIQTALQLIDPSQIELNDQDTSVFLKRAGMKLDLGALAKGYSADLIIEFFRDIGVTQGMINLGGNLLTLGPPPTKRPDGKWRVGIQDPTKPRGENRVIVKSYDQSVVTSGIYERQLTVDGKTYHHIFDSETGYPVATDVASITIISDRSVDGEIWTTRLFGKSLEEILTQVEQLEAIETIIITEDRDVYASPGIQNDIIVLA